MFSEMPFGLECERVAILERPDGIVSEVSKVEF